MQKIIDCKTLKKKSCAFIFKLLWFLSNVTDAQDLHACASVHVCTCSNATPHILIKMPPEVIKPIRTAEEVKSKRVVFTAWVHCYGAGWVVMTRLLAFSVIRWHQQADQTCRGRSQTSPFQTALRVSLLVGDCAYVHHRACVCVRWRRQ